ncbi:hypothetical protein ElyMa_003444700 [Elysia marginata]|uniref:Uncharacterized protein n=1 Tax=Elysia marginata TaxID=1093978 RepID=A0AAV4JTA4_9GAST|nr:hypothetical protein ElyMa_003444700 [Elysia marginata]
MDRACGEHGLYSFQPTCQNNPLKNYSTHYKRYTKTGGSSLRTLLIPANMSGKPLKNYSTHYKRYTKTDGSSLRRTWTLLIPANMSEQSIKKLLDSLQEIHKDRWIELAENMDFTYSS